MKCDKQLRENRADPSRLTQQTLAAALSLIPLPPPYLLITTEQTQGVSESYVGLIGAALRFFGLCFVFLSLIGLGHVCGKRTNILVLIMQKTRPGLSDSLSHPGMVTL